MNKPTPVFDEEVKKYYARLQVGTVRKRFWFGSSKKKAEQELSQTLKDIASGRITFTKVETTAVKLDTGQKDIRLEELIHKHLTWVKANRSPATYKTRKTCLKAFLKFMGACMVSSITRLRLSEFYDHAKRRHGHGDNAGAFHMREARTLLRWGEEYELIDNPIRRFPPIRYAPPRTLRFSDDEIGRLLARIPEGSFRDMIEFGLLTGLRPLELRELKKEEVVQDAQGRCFILIEQHKTSKTAKTPQPRSVPLPQEAAAIVRRQVDSHPTADYIFLNEDGTPYTAGVYRRRLERWCKRAKIPVKPPYALRHSFASLQADENTNIVSLGQLMGHTSTRTTARYIRASAEHQRQAVDRTAAHILALMPASPKSETGEKVASNVASNSSAENETGGSVDGTACISTS
jgi:integrase